MAAHCEQIDQRAGHEEARADFMPVWAGQAAPLVRELPAAQLIEELMAEAQSIMRQKGSAP